MPTLPSLDGLITDVSGMPTTLNGTPLSIKKALTQVISAGNSVDPVEAMDLALRIFRAEDGTIDLNDREVRNLQELVEKDRTFTNVIKAALIQALKPESLKTPVSEDEPEPAS